MGNEETKKCPYCAEVIKKEAVVCRFCGYDLKTGKPATLPSSEAIQEVPKKVQARSDKRAEIELKSSMAGIGCLLQFFGLASLLCGLAIIATVIGPIILWPLGLWLLLAGSRKAWWYECSHCGVRLNSKKLKICPGCNSNF